MNPVWLANEVVYYGFAKSAGLRVPDAAILLSEKEIYFGSEKRNGRDQLKDEQTLVRLIDQHPENSIQLTEVLLLDLALLNNDRVMSAILEDKAGDLWFIDHDKSLWGDGKEHNNTPQAGDLGRIDVSHLPQAVCRYVGDYLPLQTANFIVWNRNWAQVTEIFQSLPLNEETFDQIKQRYQNRHRILVNLFNLTVAS